MPSTSSVPRSCWRCTCATRPGPAAACVCGPRRPGTGRLLCRCPPHPRLPSTTSTGHHQPAATEGRTMTIDQETTVEQAEAGELDAAAVQAFAGRFLGILNEAAVAVLTSVGHQTGLFDTLAGLPAATSEQIADAAGLDERYVREWLG